jgi:hypothetical protein
MKLSLRNGSLLLVALVVGCRQPRPPLRNGFLPPELEQQRPPSAVLPTVFSMPARDVIDSSTVTPLVSLADTEPTHRVTHHRIRTLPHPSDAPTQLQAGNLQPEVSAIGQLSTGSNNATLPNKIEISIATTENALNQLHRTLTRQQQHTVAQIREFLKEARQALESGDSDGAAMLADKASILLRELHP